MRSIIFPTANDERDTFKYLIYCVNSKESTLKLLLSDDLLADSLIEEDYRQTRGDG